MRTLTRHRLQSRPNECPELTTNDTREGGMAFSVGIDIGYSNLKIVITAPESGSGFREAVFQPREIIITESSSLMPSGAPNFRGL
jgi:hypothetical protein